MALVQWWSGWVFFLRILQFSMRTSKAPPKSVAFSARPDLLFIEPRRRVQTRRSTMEKQLFEKYDGSRVTEDMLQEASQLFGDHYGVWGEHATQAVGKFAKAGEIAFTVFVYRLRNTKAVTYDSVREDFEPNTYPMTSHAPT